MIGGFHGLKWLVNHQPGSKAAVTPREDPKILMITPTTIQISVGFQVLSLVLMPKRIEFESSPVQLVSLVHLFGLSVAAISRFHVINKYDPQMLHVWSVYLPLPQTWPKCS